MCAFHPNWWDIHKLIAQCVYFIWINYRIFYLPGFSTYYNDPRKGASNAVNIVLLWHRPILCYHVCEDEKRSGPYEMILWDLWDQHNAVGATYLLISILYIFSLKHLPWTNNERQNTDISNRLVNLIHPFWLLLVLFFKKCKEIT